MTAVRIEPDVPVLFGETLKQKRRSFLCKSGSAVELLIPMLDSNGDAINFSQLPYLENATWKARFVEAVLRQTPSGDATPVVLNSNEGTLTVAVPDTITTTPAVYEFGVGAFNADDKLLLSNEFYLYVEPSVWASGSSNGASNLPTVDAVRLVLRDSDVLENELLHARQFSLTDIAMAVIQAVHAFNCAPPNIPRLDCSSATYPDYDTFLQGIKTILFEVLLEHYRKNSLPYQAAGITINDNKLNEYTQAYQYYVQQYTQACTRIKVMANLSFGIGMTRGAWWPRRI